MTKNQELLVYFAKKHSKPTITVLMKLCYLTDLISFRENKKQITTYEYIRYTFGPFDKNIYSDLENLVKTNVLKSELVHGDFGDDTENVVYRINEKNKTEIVLNNKTQTIVDQLLSALGGRGASELTQIAYTTKPMLKLGAKLGGNEGIGTKLDLAAE